MTKVVVGDKVPNWLCEIIDYGDGGKFKLPLLDYHTYLDHFETRKTKDGKKIYISQPYDTLGYYEMKHLVEICDKHDIRFEIRADSDHCPGRTLMIEWSQKNA
jgi:hypothetical protein